MCFFSTLLTKFVKKNKNIESSNAVLNTHGISPMPQGADPQRKYICMNITSDWLFCEYIILRTEGGALFYPSATSRIIIIVNPVMVVMVTRSICA